MYFKKKTDGFSLWLQTNAPTLAFWVASIIIILFDLRVMDVVYTLTNGNWLLVIGSIFATGFMFFVWKNSFQYTLASISQVRMATFGMAISLLAAAIFGGMDYFVRGGLEVDLGEQVFDAVDLVFWGIPVLSTIHVVMLLLYWYLDPVVTADRKRREADDDHQFAENEMKHASELLQRSTKLQSDFVEMVNKYGREAALMQVELLGMDRKQFESIKIPEKPKDKNTASMTEPTIPITNEPPVTAGLNGHGKEDVINPIKAEVSR